MNPQMYGQQNVNFQNFYNNVNPQQCFVNNPYQAMINNMWYYNMQQQMIQQQMILQQQQLIQQQQQQLAMQGSGNINNTNTEEPKPIIRRGEEFIQADKDFPNENKTNLRNIYMHASSGLKVLIAFPLNKTVKELFLHYCAKIGISPNLLGKEIIFLHAAQTIPINTNALIKDFFKSDLCVVTVIDQNNVIGAKNVNF